MPKFSNYGIHHGNAWADAGLPEGYIVLWAGKEIPLGFIPVKLEEEFHGGYLHIMKVNNLDWIEWYNKREGPAWWYDRTNRP